MTVEASPSEVLRLLRCCIVCVLDRQTIVRGEIGHVNGQVGGRLLAVEVLRHHHRAVIFELDVGSLLEMVKVCAGRVVLLGGVLKGDLLRGVDGILTSGEGVELVLGLLGVEQELRVLLLHRGDEVLTVLTNVGESCSSHGREVMLTRRQLLLMLLLLPRFRDEGGVGMGELWGEVLGVVRVMVPVELLTERAAGAVAVVVGEVGDLRRLVPAIHILRVDDDSIIVVVAVCKDVADRLVMDSVLEREVDADIHDGRLARRGSAGRRGV